MSTIHFDSVPQDSSLSRNVASNCAIPRFTRWPKPWPRSGVRRLPVSCAMRVFCVSDLHTDHKENFEWCVSSSQPECDIYADWSPALSANFAVDVHEKQRNATAPFTQQYCALQGCCIVGHRVQKRRANMCWGRFRRLGGPAKGAQQPSKQMAPRFLRAWQPRAVD